MLPHIPGEQRQCKPISPPCHARPGTDPRRLWRRPTTSARTGSAASAATAAANGAVAESLPLGDQRDFEDASRGLIASQKPLKVTDANGRVLWNMEDYAFIEGDAPDSVNPSLWRQAKLNNINGLFEVTKGSTNFAVSTWPTSR